MGQEIVLPDNFGAPAQAFLDAGLNAETDNLAEGIGQSYGVIGYKGKVWSLRYRGQRHTIVRPDDGTPSGHLDVIILDAATVKSKSYYPKWDANQSEGERPACASLDGVTPDSDSPGTKEHPGPQASACAICPRNEWKTDSNGKKGRDCQDYKRLAVLLMPNVTEKVLGQKLMEPVFLRVPPASLNSLAILGETMGKRGYHSSAYITRVTFDPDKSWPEMVFRPLQGLRAEEAPAIILLSKDPVVRRIVHGDRSRSGLQGGQQALVPAYTPPISSEPASFGGAFTPVTERPVLEMQASSPNNTFALPVTSEVPAASPLLPTGLAGLGGATAAPPRSPPSPPLNGNAAPYTPLVATQTPADLGVTEESDADLDAKIAEILAKKSA